MAEPLHFIVEDVTCPSCIGKIEGGLVKLPEVAAARLNFTTHRLEVQAASSRLTPDAVVAALEGLGHRTAPYDPARLAQARDGEDKVIPLVTKIASGFMLTPEEEPCGANPRAFNHAGAGGSLGYCDPEAGMGFGYTMNHMHMGAWLIDPRARALVDTRGRFTIRLREGKRYHLIAKHPNWVGERAEVVARRDATSVELKMTQDGATLGVRCLNAAGAPVEGLRAIARET